MQVVALGPEVTRGQRQLVRRAQPPQRRQGRPQPFLAAVRRLAAAGLR